MPSQENQHCADCIGAFSFPVPINIEIGRRVCTGQADMTSGVARNFRQGVRKSVAFLSVHSRLAALPSDRPYNQKKSWHIIPPEWLKNIGTSARLYARRPITLRNHIYLPKNYVFSWRGAYAPCMATPLDMTSKHEVHTTWFITAPPEHGRHDQGQCRIKMAATDAAALGPLKK